MAGGSNLRAARVKNRNKNNVHVVNGLACLMKRQKKKRGGTRTDLTHEDEMYTLPALHVTLGPARSWGRSGSRKGGGVARGRGGQVEASTVRMIELLPNYQ